MDDVEDDARYPPNPYPSNSRHRHHSAHSQRPKPPSHPQFHRNFNDQEDEDEDESNSDGINHRHNNSAVNNSGHHQPADYMEEGEDEEAVEDEDDDHDSSLESRGKRRKLDNFEFVPRKPTAVIPNTRPPAVKNSPPDWSEDSTFLLLDAWGDLFVKNGRKSIRSDEWSEVAKKVNQASRITRSDSQCRNRLDTLKKKYKKEKARMAEHVNFKSDWAYFKKMDSLMSSSSPVPPAAAAAAAARSSPVRLACGVDAGEYVFANPRVYLKRANAMEEMRDSPGDTGTDDDEAGDDDESDGLPPTMSEKKKGRVQSGSFSSSSSFRMLADSIQKFGEVYEKIESNKRQQMAELERMRKEFHRDLEVQKRQILERAQAEIARIRQEEGGEEEEEEKEEEEERMTGEGDGDDDEDDEIDGSAENLSG